MTTWRNSITVHPLANTFPMMSDGELKELAADIEKNGQLTPVQFALVDGKKTLIDGRNRLAACFLIGKKPEEVTVANSDIFKDEATIEAYIVSQNVYRRHLTPEQRAAVLEAVIKAAPGKSDRELGRAANVSHKTIGRTRKKMESTGTLVPSSKRTGKDGKARAVPKAKPKKPVAEPTSTPPPDQLAAAGNGFSATSSTTSTNEESVKQRTATVSEGNAAGVDEFKECCARLFPTFDRIDLAEVRSHFDRECSKYAAALRQGMM